MTKTTNYNLNQWDAGDRVLRTDFNADNAAIDAAIAAVKSASEEGLAAVNSNLGAAGKNARIAWGTYKGTGTYGADNPTSLNVDFYPVLVIVGSTTLTDYAVWPSIFIRNCPASHSDISSTEITVTWTENGLSWYDTKYANGQLQNNDILHTYVYCVIGYDKSAE